MTTWVKKETLFQSDRTLVFRVLNPETQQTHIIKSLNIDHPTAGDLARFFHEYEILAQLSPLQGTLPAIEKLIYLDRHSFVFPDPGGTALAQLISKPVAKPLGLKDFFRVAISISQTLGRIHSKGIIHKDINPNNLISLPDFSQSWVIDYSIAAKTKRELQLQKPVQDLEGTLHYLAPEQSGRINRSLDYRADYYSLGITFFELLTGRRPFHREQTIELLHDHIATPFPDPIQLRSEIPVSLAQVVRKLAAKDPDNRYQSAWGIVSDLKRCEELWTLGESTSTFALGQDDLSEILLIPEKIYGRAQVVQSLLRTFEERQAKSNLAGHLTLIAGASGVGKSALVHELTRPVSAKKGFLLEGKIDQFQRDRILFGFSQPLVKFFDLLAGESRATLMQIKSELAEKLRSNVGVITDLFPEVAVYLDKEKQYPKPSPIGPKETKDRLLEAFEVLFQTIASKKSLVLFIDDLQWADLTTFEVIEHLTKLSLPGFMFMGAYRSNEVAEGHPLQTLMKNLGANVSIFELNPLQDHSVKELLADTLGPAQRLDDVTQKLFRKTGGNPFFIHQLLKKLYAEEILIRDPANKAWHVDLERLDALQVSANVVEFILAKLRILDETTQTVLTAGAAYGAKFSFHLIARVIQKDPNTLIRAFQKAVDEEIIRPSRGRYQHLISSGQFDPNSHYDLEFQFLHDRLQQASYELKGEAERKKIHLSLGELLCMDSEERPGQISAIEIADQYLKADINALSETYRAKISDRIIQAAVQAKGSSNFAKAFEYIQRVQSICPDTFWKSQPLLMRKLYLESSQIAFLAGEREECGRSSQVLFTRATNDYERAEAYSILSDQAKLLGKHAEAVEFGLQGLGCLGVKLHTNTSVFRVVKELIITLQLLKSFKKAPHGYLSILELKSCEDQNTLMIQKCMTAMATPAYQLGKINLVGVMTFIGTQMSFKHGLSETAVIVLLAPF